MTPQLWGKNRYVRALSDKILIGLTPILVLVSILHIAVSDTGMRDHVLRLLSEAKTKFSLGHTIKDKTYSTGETRFNKFQLGDLTVLWFSYETKYRVAIWSGNDEFDDAALYIAEGLKNNPSVRDTSLEWHNLEKAQIASNNLGQKGKVETDASTKTTTREIVKEKQVIVKIRCSFCRKTYDETLDKCPNCGA